MQRIAIIGSGIAGMACAWYLRDYYDVTLIEQNNYIGGHTNTQLVNESGRQIPIDTGFMVYNQNTYPNLLNLFAELGVDSVETDMSFGVNNLQNGLNYSSSGISGLFAKRSNLVNPSHWALISGILKFFKAANRFLDEYPDSGITVTEFFKYERLSMRVANTFLLPMASAIWSTHNTGIGDYPALALFRFMRNHGLLGANKQFKWRTLQGGSMQYRDRLIARLPNKPIHSSEIKNVIQVGDQVEISGKNLESRLFDYVVIAAHADQALSMLTYPTNGQANLLQQFQYTENHTVLHSDTSVMPQNLRAWASWNYRIEPISNSGTIDASTHYWMNNLQPLDTTKPYFVSVDYSGDIDPTKVHWSTTYHHPFYNQEAIKAQKHLPRLNEEGPIYFCGSYFKNGFHEDALVSALNVVKKLKERKGVTHEILPV